MSKELDILVKDYFIAASFLPYRNSFQCLIATLLSHRTRDVVTARVCALLFKRLNSPEDILCMTNMELHDKIRSVNYSKRKTQILKDVCFSLYKSGHYSYPFPSLAYVGRKTMDVLQNNFSTNKRIAVDSNVLRFARRYFNTSSYSLYNAFSHNLHYFASSSLIAFSREICTRVPKCYVCKVRLGCSFYDKNEKR